MKKIISIMLALTLALTAVISVPARSEAYSVPANMKWWQNDRFGMFIHLGSYSQYGNGEWAMQVEKISKKKYQTTISSKFNPTKFNATEIVKYAKKAGMKYIVITAKHHEGLSMWDTKVSSFKDYTGKKMYSLQQYTPFGKTNRDILMELKNACKKENIKFGLYYSILDWSHSSQTKILDNGFTKMSSMTARSNYIKDMKAQLKELITTYDPSIMWFDGDWTNNKKKATLSSWWTKSDGKSLYNYLKKLSPSMLVNERVCRGFKLGDFECPEQEIPFAPLSRPWETCQTMNDAWGYKKSCENSYGSTTRFVEELTTTASLDGNYLLNIGPKGDGSMTKGSKKVLNGVGKWMKTYSSSVYGTSRSPFKKTPSWGTYTRKGKTVYVHVYKWPKKGKLKVSRYKGKKLKLKKVYIMGKSGKKLKYTKTTKKVTIKLPKKAPNKSDTVIVMKYA